MAVICDDKIDLIVNIDEDESDEDVEKDAADEQAGRAYGLDVHVHVIENDNQPNHSIDDNDNNADNTAEALAGDIVDIELEEGKEYHLFFCHSSVDLAWVMDVVKVLEAPPYNLKCAYSERDFMPGQNDMNEMFRCITGSMRVVFVLTPAFLDSRWCEWEMQMAQTASVANNISLLPIMLQECAVPDTIKHINYIDVVHKDVHKAALMLQKNVEKPGQGFLPQNSALRINGSSFPIRERTIKNGCCGEKLKFELPPSGMDALEQRGITIPEENIKKILYGLTQHEKVIRLDRPTWKGACFQHLTFALAGLWFTFTMINSIYSLRDLSKIQYDNSTCYMAFCFVRLDTTFTGKNCNIFIITINIILILLSICPLIALAVFKILRRRKLRKVIKVIKDVSLNTLTNNNMYIWLAKTGQYFHIVKYNIKPCWQHIIQPLDIKDIDTWNQNITEIVFPLYMDKLMMGTLDKAHIVVHQTIHDQICFCQFFQDICPQFVILKTLAMMNLN